MDPAAVAGAVEAVWPLVATGAVQRIGERGTDELTQQARWLWERVSGRRREQGITDVPPSRAELQSDLAQLAIDDPAVARLITQIADRQAQVRQTNQTVIGHNSVFTTFNGAVEIETGYFGITPRS